jgi:hypothetical protein
VGSEIAECDGDDGADDDVRGGGGKDVDDKSPLREEAFSLVEADVSACLCAATSLGAL